MIRFQFACDHRNTHEVKRMCAVWGIQRSSYYKWRNAAADRAVRQASDYALVERIRDHHEAWDATYWYRRITAVLADDLEVVGPVNHKRVARLMRERGIVGVHLRKAKTTTVRDPGARFLTIGLKTKRADECADAVIDWVSGLPELMQRSLAWDQGSEMAQHARVTEATGLPVFFADPHSPWQRGSNENTNRLYREYLPKGTVIPNHQPYLDAIAFEINHRPRARLGFLTPIESYQRLLEGKPHIASTAGPGAHPGSR